MGTVEQVVIARRTGFCYGVREAIDYARWPRPRASRRTPSARSSTTRASSRSSRAQGIRTVDSLDEVDAGAAVVIRAHGVTPDVMAAPRARAWRSSTAPAHGCWPEQRELKKLVEEGYTIVLLGTPKHPEAIGLLGHAPDAIVVDEESEWDSIPRRKRMALMSQSTQPPWKFERLAAFMVSRAHELKIVNTVCPVTIRRQQDTMELAAQVDLVVVVGGRTSANTAELTRLVRDGRQAASSRSRAPHDIVDAAPSRARAWSASPAARRRRSRTSRRSPLGSSRSPARRSASPTPQSSLARHWSRVAEPAYRSTSIGRADRSAPVASTVGRRLSVAGRKGRRSSRGSEASGPIDGLPVVAIVGRPNVGKCDALQPHRRRAARRSSRTARARRATACTRRRSGTAGASSSSTPAARDRPGDAIEEKVQEQARLAIERGRRHPVPGRRCRRPDPR